MPTMDSTAAAAIAGSAFAPGFFIFLDVSGDPIRATTVGSNVTFASTGDPDLDGKTFNAFDGRFVEVGEVANTETGSDTLTIELSGIVSIDSTLLNEIGNPALWQGRSCRLWFQIYDAAGTTPQGAIVPYYTGYMSSVRIQPSPKGQTIRVSIENYLAAFSDPSNRSYLNQKDYDSADVSAAATIAASNGAVRGGIGVGGGNIGTSSGMNNNLTHVRSY
jgi:hypothetical protein